jgi:hypothetical protein
MAIQAIYDRQIVFGGGRLWQNFEKDVQHEGEV